jgi:hypothetical protein
MPTVPFPITFVPKPKTSPEAGCIHLWGGTCEWGGVGLGFEGRSRLVAVERTLEYRKLW